MSISKVRWIYLLEYKITLIVYKVGFFSNNGEEASSEVLIIWILYDIPQDALASNKKYNKHI